MTLENSCHQKTHVSHHTYVMNPKIGYIQEIIDQTDYIMMNWVGFNRFGICQFEIERGDGLVQKSCTRVDSRTTVHSCKYQYIQSL